MLFLIDCADTMTRSIWAGRKLTFELYYGLIMRLVRTQINGESGIPLAGGEPGWCNFNSTGAREETGRCWFGGGWCDNGRVGGGPQESLKYCSSVINKVPD